LGLAPSTTRVGDIFQQTALVDDEVRQALGVDVVPIFLEPREWRKGTLADGSPAELPERFRPVHQEDGSRLYLDSEGNVVAKMPKGGPYFDPVFKPLADAITVSDVDKNIDHIVSYDTPSFLDKSFEELAQKAKTLRETTDYGLVGFYGGHILQAGQVLRGWEAFLMDLLVNQKLAHAMMDRLLQANLERFEQFATTVGQHLDVMLFEEDLGMQDRPLMSPKTFRTMLKPYMKKLFEFAKSHCDAYLLFHSDGAIAPLIPDLIEIGVDALNPIQVSAAGMDAKTLKTEYGKDLAFWGAGCDSQSTLPFGTPEDVADEVKRNIDHLAEGGGFVFAPIHNVQAGVPPENAVTMFKTAREYGVYR
jgi:uroporphyrinogen decarboxylase